MWFRRIWYRNSDRIRIVLSVVLVIAIISTVILTIHDIDKRCSPAFSVTDEPVTVILDPGHGGEDGGAVGYDGITVEKDINLAVALKLRDLLKLGGFNVIMTRQEDVSTCDSGLKTVKQRKTSDIVNRLKVAKENSNAIFVSIHQNQFTQSQYWGTQIFYGRHNPDSAVLAETLQRTFRELLQNENKREHKKSGKEIYILYNSEIPTVMVECGFLSNPDECKLLCDDGYQNQVAFTVYTGLMKYIESCKQGL